MREKKGRFPFLWLVFILVVMLSFSSSADALEKRDYDVIVVGAGTGGLGAAIQAARLGVKVAVFEETTVLGGQMIASAVSTMDDMYGTRWGIYGEFLEGIFEYYSSRGKSVGTCYWTPITVAFEPHVGEYVLANMIKGVREGKTTWDKKPGVLDLYTGAKVRSVLKSGDGKTVTGIVAEAGGTKLLCYSKVLIDATEYGDLLPLAGADYRVGKNLVDSESRSFDEDARVQDITWVAVIKHYPGGVPDELKVKTPPPGYEDMRKTFMSYVARDGSTFKRYPLKYPVDVLTHNAYRGLPDSLARGNADASSPLTWLMLTKTEVNWANDYPGKEGYKGKTGLPVTYLEDPAFRKEVDARAMLVTIGFIYYLQNELGCDWSVASDIFELEATYENIKDYLPSEYAEIAKHFPPRPYVRESRRVVGIKTLTSREIRENSESYMRNEGRELRSSLAVGRYLLDLHGADETEQLEAEFGETRESIAKNKPLGPFQVPFEIFIPKETDGFLVAEKNLSVTRLASGALRLQPITMLTGQAVGAIAALAVKEGVQPRDVNVMKVQKTLLEAKDRLALCIYSDVPESHPHWAAVQMATVRGWMKPKSLPTLAASRIDNYNDILQASRKGRTKGIFGVDEPLSWEVAKEFLSAILDDLGGQGKVDLHNGMSEEPIPRGEFIFALCRALYPSEEPKPITTKEDKISWAHKKLSPILSVDKRDLEEGLTRGEALNIVMEVLTN
ncbi:FAD dependent oxidoreductase [Acetomicrobium thermoterrenum DSM 13490]|uniref:FAD dependent oxidoreductase n=1 Tax=Acetomicrobium thermoterrenum DSM 13490 TaxID=1120987 RepID=A0A1H3G2K7_9BACT|nr:FAD-dependent oxidoreductase [Acetomicrobium thermoterrenum]SDX96599.1 FAD dependent oxidoreductase [Acetomicrobium thermoterrenum DSM 13490]